MKANGLTVVSALCLTLLFVPTAQGEFDTTAFDDLLQQADRIVVQVGLDNAETLFTTTDASDIEQFRQAVALNPASPGDKRKRARFAFEPKGGKQ